MNLFKVYQFNFPLFTIIALILSISCNNVHESKAESSKEDQDSLALSAKDNDSVLEPLFRRGYYIQPSIGNSLTLDSIFNGYDSLQIRLWIVQGLFGHRQLYIIRNNRGKWEANYYILTLDSNYANGNGSREFLHGPEPFNVAVSKAVSPKMGWHKLMDSLQSLNVFEMPDMSEIKGMEVNWTHPTGYCIEIATRYNYRYYKYYDPHRFEHKFWQAANIGKTESLLIDQLLR
jgi:hypothetical protein